MANEPETYSESHQLMRAAASLGGTALAVGTSGSIAIAVGLAVGDAAGSIGATVVAMPLWRIAALGCVGFPFFVLFVVFVVFSFTGLPVVCRAAGDRLAACIGSTRGEPEDEDRPEAGELDPPLLPVLDTRTAD